jgi:GNAT superfamily N-acetyltransferase
MNCGGAWQARPVRISVVSAEGAEAEHVLSSFFDELARIFGYQPAHGVPTSPADFTPPRGQFLAVRDDEGAVVGGAGVRLLDPGTAEIKRMWVDPATRGQGVGRALLAELEAAARSLGATTAVLDTHETLASAIALYRGSGWLDVPPYNDNGAATHWFRKRLGDDAPGGGVKVGPREA